jgi:hypothetical protein
MINAQTTQSAARRSEPKDGWMQGCTRAQPTRRMSSRSVTMILAVVTLVISSMLPAMQASAQDSPSDWAPPSTVYIPETGHSLDRLFLDLWRNAGGASAFGYPISPEITTEDGHVVQYLQYARFEYWPEGDENGNTVILGKIGKELRPIPVQRSLIASTQPDNSAVLLDPARQMKAWLPIEASQVGGDAVYVEATQHSVAHGFLTFWQNTGGESYLGNPLTEEYTLDGTTYQVFERGQLTWKPGSDISMVPVGKMLAEKYGVSTEPIAQGSLPTYSENLFVPQPEPSFEVADAGPGPVPGAPKSIVVSISQQRMWAYEGDTAVLSSLVSTGKPGFDTPIGTFSIIVKKEIEDMEGLIGGEYYNVTDVPDVMYFTDVGHAFHGTYWHNNFGAVMSHGCVNLPVDVASILYDWTPMGTPVQVVN